MKNTAMTNTVKSTVADAGTSRQERADLTGRDIAQVDYQYNRCK
ncbi:hypothetical protein CAter282_3353 [Collimonas arenae]|uniref:Uncharacterized protein n=1 Tax=Collimonas arenae TaxID=279058 RepID=A0A127QM26_9BURK|nr:hypothetical protein [Collimonas arenae]AMP01151.1 hypothetical protein CAter10_3676 [Collimonas arenae]AMP11046.1 hypothetical protein CAter282_3353 [Collimonas arenae]